MAGTAPQGGGTDEHDPDVDTVIHEREGSVIDSWPAIVMSIGIVAAAIYSFTPRPDPDLPASSIHPERFLANSLAQQGSRILGAGEQGIIMFADSPQGPWQQASVATPRGSTLTRIRFVGDNTAVAVGHDSWVLRSTDGGLSWTETLFRPEKSEPLLSVAGPYGGQLYALGAFGQFQVSTDLGQSWSRLPIVAAEVETKEAAYDPTTDPESSQYDPFAAFSSGSIAEDFSTFHLNDMAQLQNGAFLMVGERGLIARSTDDTETWEKLADIYSGSFYGVLPVGAGRVLIHGMRGHAFYSDDFGDNWVASRVPTDESFFGSQLTAAGQVVLVGGNNTIIVSTDQGESFRKVSAKGADAIAAVLPAPGGWLTAGEAGIAVQKPVTAVAASSGAGS